MARDPHWEAPWGRDGHGFHQTIVTKSLGEERGRRRGRGRGEGRGGGEGERARGRGRTENICEI